MSTTSPVAVAVPDIGDFREVPIIEIHVAPGDRVAAEDPLVTLESDKATMDVPAPASGVVRELSAKVGDRVSEGDLLLTIEPEESAPANTAMQAGQATSPPEPAPRSADTDGKPPPTARPAAGPAIAGPRPDHPIYASPSVRRLARELAVDLTEVTGTGRKGRITRADVEAVATGTRAPASRAAGPSTGALRLELPPWPEVDFAKFGPVERVQRSRIQRISAPNLARNWVAIPHVTHHDEADITELEAWRRRLNEEHEHEGVKVTMVSFLVLACVSTLKRFPTFNASLDGEELVLKRYYNIGFAADTPEGLVVPVIRDADRKGLLEVARELGVLSHKAREGKLSPTEITGSTFTISSLGGIGGTAFTPIVNAPEVAILGVTRAATKPVWNGREFVPRLMLPLSLSYDHRVIDGAAAARFVAHLANVLGDLRQALL
jgi:pyruvate dehydrogenase E2 component (dihydrolipoamide acetyltransferase)